MKVRTTLRMHQPLSDGQQVKLFNLTGPGRSAAADQALTRAKELARKKKRLEKKAFDWLGAGASMTGLDLFGGPTDTVADWSNYYQQGARKGLDPQLMADRANIIKRHVDVGGQYSSSPLRNWLGSFNPHTVRHTGYNQSLNALAKQYTDSGMSPEQAMQRAQQALGPREDFQQSLDDQLYQSGTTYQQLQMLSDPMRVMEARARSRVRGDGSGGNFFTEMVGGLKDYFGGQESEQLVAKDDARENLKQYYLDQKQQMMDPAARSQAGYLQDMEQARDNWLAQRGAWQPSAANKRLQLEQETADWRRERGLLGLMPFFGAREGETGRLQEDIRHAREGSWGDLTKPWRYAQRFGNWVRGQEYSPHQTMMETNPAYAQQVRALGTDYQIGDDLSSLMQGSAGREASIFNPRGWGTGGIVDRREGVDFEQALGGNEKFQKAQRLQAAGFLSRNMHDQMHHGLSSIEGSQRKNLGIDQAYESGLDERTRNTAGGWLAASDVFKNTSQEDFQKRMAEAQKRRSGMVAKDGLGSTTVLKTGFANPIYDRQPVLPDLAGEWGAHRPATAYQQSREFSPPPPTLSGRQETLVGGPSQALAGLHRAQADWQLQTARAKQERARPLVRRLSPQPRSWRTRLSDFWKETKEDLGLAPDNAVAAQEQIAAGKWDPSLSIDQAATGGGWRPIGGLTDWLGLTSSPEEQRQQMYTQALKSRKWQDLEQQYARGLISDQQFQELAGVPLTQAYAKNPQRLMQLMTSARKNRAQLSVQSLLQHAENRRTEALGSYWDGLNAI